jgi:hypothetical protein
MNRGRVICALTLALAALPAAALAQEGAPPAPAPGEQQAEALLAEAQEALAEAQEPPGAAPEAEPGRELTLTMAQLSEALPALDPVDRRVARSILARPDDGAADRWGDGYTAPEAPDSPHCDPDLCVHWVDSTADRPPLDDDNGADDGDGVPDFVEKVLASARRSYATENTALGWIEPVGDADRGEDEGSPDADRTDVYLLETQGAYFGYSSPDEGQNGAVERQAYLVLDDDFREFVSPALSRTAAMRVTMAHEYNHVLQFAYDSLEDLWMFEATATWMEEQVYPAIDDYVGYVGSFARSSTVPLTANTPDFLKIYGAAVWNHYLTSAHGPAVVRDAWDASPVVSPPDLAIASYESALGGAGNPFDLVGDEFAAFAGLTAEWRAQPGTFPDAALLPNVRRLGELRPGRHALRVELDHLAYALLDVPPAAGADELELRVRAPDGTHFGLGLVGRTGAPVSGSITEEAAVDDDGGQAGVTLAAGAYDRLTAVVANADARVNLATRRYSRNNQEFRVKLVRSP